MRCARDILKQRDRFVVSRYGGVRGISTWPAESKPNSRITKTKMIGVMIIVSSIIDRKSQRRGKRAKHQSKDSRRQTRRKHASRTPERLDLSSCYFLKRSNIDISQNPKFSWDASTTIGAIRIDGWGCKISRIKYLIDCATCDEWPNELAGNF
jgi:hypothetical protein